ncbi:hypothetical protein CHU92_00425 [Flavobacterium cyanobacteriorum]|uniref:Uncharacterized protein n=1 Tax=Flavobacterium cyanobacteriorum TaxID=2022802 RepID=A0A256A647_9FLAO|nr:hypothetical protein CHU92_00425 [Flavobacterium cyanobacteriorum]
MINLLNNKTKVIILLILYLLGALGISLIYIFDFENNIIVYSIFFAIVVVINKLSSEIIENKNKHFILFSLIPFLTYLLFLIIYKQDYFVRYKLLILFPLLLSLYQMFKIVKFGK